ncbi:MAG: S-adenosylmethionine:tRNA ribosyltransferase-isomerase, partial [Parvularculaceae bacterium]
MRVSEFDYDLPQSLIALAPAPRGAARLLHVRPDAFEDRIVRELPALLRAGDVIVVNDTKVIPAQLLGRRPAREAGGASIAIDVTLHKRLLPEAAEGARWKAFVRPAKRLRDDDVLDFGAGLSALVEQRDEAQAVLRFNRAGPSFDAALLLAGKPPLPPYIARKRETRPE